MAKRKPKTEDEILKEMKPATKEVEMHFNGSPQGHKVIVPMQEPDDSTYVGRHSGRIDVRLDKGEQVNNFRQLYSALKLNNHKLKNGRYVDSANDVIKWMLENISA